MKGILTLTLVLCVFITPAFPITISDIRVSNHSSSSVVISWITDVVTNDNRVNYGTTKALGSTASDTRVDDTHYVEITGLDPETTYYFEVVSDGTTDDNGGNKYEFKTAKVGTGTSYVVYGKVYKADGVTPAEGAIVYVRVTHGGVVSHWLSTLSDSSGNWQVNLGNLKDPTTGDVLGYGTGDPMYIFFQGAADGTSSTDTTVSGSRPQGISDTSLPVILLSFTGSFDGKAVELRWKTDEETDILAWNIYRSEEGV
ncbi:fibronectin type III domain-containing protein [Candidatus Poribacteria bacterium]|nr:fibronectin type III domain-containing protein [Candidatus Poribacteria bacterium]